VTTRKLAATYGGAAVLGHLSQFAWLGLGSRTMSTEAFGTVLAAQALYGFLQVVIDAGPGFYGARLAASRGLDALTRGSIVRLRLQLALVAAGVALAVGAAADARSLEATAPFAVALVLFGALNYWEAFGLGNARPWSAYVVLRSLAPAGAALTLFLLGRSFPLVLAGIAECGVIVVVSLAFRLSARTGISRAFSAPRGPWRSVTRIGLPVVIGQMGLACGTILLNATGAAAAAAAFAVSVRLLTGINQLAGVLATALFPRLAGAEASEDVEGHGVEMGVRALVVVTFGATAVLMFRPRFVTSLLLGHAGDAAQAAAVLTLATSCATGFVVLFTLVLLARNGEDVFLRVYVAATTVILGGGIVVVLVSPAPRALAMASVFAVGQLVGMFLLARHALVSLPNRKRAVRHGAIAALVLVAVGFLAATTPGVRGSASVVTAVTALVVASAAVTRRRLGAPATDSARPGF